MPYAITYTRIYIVFSIFNVFNVTMNNIVSSEGAAKTVGIPIFRISDIISFAKQHSLTLKLNTLFFRSM